MWLYGARRAVGARGAAASVGLACTSDGCTCAVKPHCILGSTPFCYVPHRPCGVVCVLFDVASGSDVMADSVCV